MWSREWHTLNVVLVLLGVEKQYSAIDHKYYSGHHQRSLRFKHLTSYYLLLLTEVELTTRLSWKIDLPGVLSSPMDGHNTRSVEYLETRTTSWMERKILSVYKGAFILLGSTIYLQFTRLCLIKGIDFEHSVTNTRLCLRLNLWDSFTTRYGTRSVPVPSDSQNHSFQRKNFSDVTGMSVACHQHVMTVTVEVPNLRHRKGTSQTHDNTNIRDNLLPATVL